eukprot:m.140574 g.140574  ORF g.140574 m.140574 type:complete len:327 (+) comp15964_c2_seq2:106-1086(+)
MPEAHDLWYMARFVTCQSRHLAPFVCISKSDLATDPEKHPDVKVDFKEFQLSAESRGKEMMLAIQPMGKHSSDYVNVLLRAGMTGGFGVAEPNQDLPKHAHLRFHAKSGHTLYFEDQRRFGSWHLTSDWGPPNERGPCVISEFEDMLKNVEQHLSSSLFSKPICEVLMDQSYFNGIGNVLRAEILHRAKVHPFSQARAVLKPAIDAEKQGKEGFFFHFRHVLEEATHIMEKFNFEAGKDHERLRDLEDWQQCYGKLHKEHDSHGRTVWYDTSLRKLEPVDSEETTPTREAPGHHGAEEAEKTGGHEYKKAKRATSPKRRRARRATG